MSEKFWVCIVPGCRNPTHHYKAEACQTCGGKLKEINVRTVSDLNKMLGIPEKKGKK